MSVVMRTQRPFVDENGRLPQYASAANVRSCKCCPYGYHIDLDFVRYCEMLANAKPSEDEMRRRGRRRSRKSMEFMLGLESLFDQWDADARVHMLPEVPQESEPESPRVPKHTSTSLANAPFILSTAAAFATSTPCSSQRPRSSSVPRFTYGGLTRADSPFGTASSTCSSLRGGVESDVPYPMRRPANSPPETRAFLHDALDEVCSDFERTLERTSARRKKAIVNGGGPTLGTWSDRNNNNKITSNGFSSLNEKRNCHTWDKYYDVLDNCVTGNKTPRVSHSLSTLPLQRKPSPAEKQYEDYVQATVAANAKSPVELDFPPQPPRRRTSSTQSASKYLSPSSTECEERSPLSDKLNNGTMLSPLSNATDAGATNDAQTLFTIREQMALSLKRMKDLEEQVKTIPEMQHELTALRKEKERFEKLLQRKDEDLQRARENNKSSSPSPAASPKYPSPVQFTPQRISPISLESMGSRLRANSTSSERQLKSIMKRDVGTMCGLHSTRDVAVGSPILTQRTTGTNPAQLVNIKEMLYTQLQLEEQIKVAIKTYETQRSVQHLKNLISVGTQMYVPKSNLKESAVQTSPEKSVVKYSIGIMAKPNTRENFVNCKPQVRTVGSSDHRVTDILCEKCAVIKRTVSCATETDKIEETEKPTKQPEMPARSNTFSLGDNEKLPIKRKTIGTQCTPTVVHSTGSQTSLTVVHTVGVQNTPEVQNAGTQSQTNYAHRQTDTNDLVRLVKTQTSTDEISKPAPLIKPKPKVIPPPTLHTPPITVKPETRNTASNTEVLPIPIKTITRNTASNTEARKTVENGVNTLPPVSIRHNSSNTDEVRKRDIGCGDIIKPHISIACADNYCDSCKDAIKNLAKDFSKVLASPLPVRAADSKIPRPKHLASPIPARKQFQRQNTYTITPSPTPSPVTEKKTLESSLQEKPPSISNFHENESSSEAQSFITEPISSTPKPKAAIRTTTISKTQETLDEEKDAVLPEDETTKLFELAKTFKGPLIVKEEQSVEIKFAHDASTLPHKSVESESAAPARPDVSKGAVKKTSPVKSSQIGKLQKIASKSTPLEVENNAPSKALLQKLAMVEAEPRTKTKPSDEMLKALKIINDSLLKKMSAKPFSSASLKAAKTTIQEEWFRITSTENANPHEVEDYLDCFEELSVPMLEYCVNMVDSNGNTAMHYSLSHGNFDVVSILLDSKVCNVNQMNNAGYTCVMLVSLAKLKNEAHRTVVERLFQMADVNIRAKKHCQTALMLAVSHGNYDMVDLLLMAGADINIQDEDGSTALMCAAEHGRIDIVKQLLSHPECDSLKQDVDGATAFKIAWQAGHRDIGLILYVHEQVLRSKMQEKTNRSALLTRKPVSPE